LTRKAVCVGHGAWGAAVPAVGSGVIRCEYYDHFRRFTFDVNKKITK